MPEPKPTTSPAPARPAFQGRQVAFEITAAPDVVHKALDAHEMPEAIKTHVLALVAGVELSTDDLDVVATHGVSVNVRGVHGKDGATVQVAVKRTPIGPPKITREEHRARQLAKIDKARTARQAAVDAKRAAEKAAKHGHGHGPKDGGAA